MSSFWLWLTFKNSSWIQHQGYNVCADILWEDFFYLRLTLKVLRWNQLTCSTLELEIMGWTFQHIKTNIAVPFALLNMFLINNAHINKPAAKILCSHRSQWCHNTTIIVHSQEGMKWKNIKSPSSDKHTACETCCFLTMIVIYIFLYTCNYCSVRGQHFI